MYELRHTQIDKARFVNTCLGIRGVLYYAAMWGYDGDTCYLTATKAAEMRKAAHSEVLEVEEGDVDWLPSIRPGYYTNIHTKPWHSSWVEQTSNRQYKVGLNERNTRAYTYMAQRAGRGGPIPYGILAEVYEGANEYPDMKRAISMVKGRGQATSQCGLSHSFALEKGFAGLTFLVYRAQRYVGIVKRGTMLVESTFTHPDLENLEYQHEEIGKLRGLLGPEA